jgi:hypothetical protein
MVRTAAQNRVLHGFAVTEDRWVEGVEGTVEIEESPGFDALLGFQNALCSEKIDCAQFVVLTENLPRRSRWRIGALAQLRKTWNVHWCGPHSTALWI